MNKHYRHAQQTIEALGFTIDYDASTREKRVYRHTNSPDEPLRLFVKMTPNAAKTLIEKARQIAGLSTSGKTTTGELRQVAKTKRQLDRARKMAQAAAEEKARARYQAVADAKAARIAYEREYERKRADEAAIRSLMMPGGGW